ncbi:hypothetical protein ANCDUO_04188 [Ancylostoma duodenale]|uniref:EGF-like domain-containing protein n=1 Tax=Ancylostoma duodenale TaxID=51022 RepID=A0A0C2H7S9_9BILA|nr:hypothetical protein ANCDUO_04188 [Ancylostoma duodenale]
MVILGYIGKRCSIRDPCRPDVFNKTIHSCVHGKCVNPGVKVDHLGYETSIHECKCNRGYTGAQCSTMVNILEECVIQQLLGTAYLGIAVR